MSDYSVFESDEAAQHRPQAQARTAARHLEAAISEVRSGFGRFLLGATGIDEFEDRWHLSKNDIRAAVEPHVFPNTGTMRRIQNAMKADWKLAHPYKLALSHDDAGYGQMSTDNTHPNQDLDETFTPSSGNLIPEGDFQAYEDSVDQGGPEKVQRDFTPGGDSGSDKREAARLVADIYTDFARSNGMRVASLDTLDRYASTGIHDADYQLLESMILTAAEACPCGKPDCDCDEDSDSESPEASESDDSDSDDDEGDDYDFGGDDDAEGHDEPDADNEGGPSDHDEDNEDEDSDDEDYDFGGDDTGDDDPGMGDAGGQQYTVPEQAPDLEPQMLDEIPHENPQGAAPVPPEVVDSLLGLPPGTIEQLLLEEVQQGQGGAPEQGGAPQGGGEDFFGGGGDDAEQEPPRVARRRQAGDTYIDHAHGGTKRYRDDGKGGQFEVHPETGEPYHDGPRVKVPPHGGQDRSYGDDDVNRSFSARRFWASEEDESGGEAAGGGAPAAPPAQDPAAAGGAPPMDPAAMAQPQLPPPGSQAVAPPAPAMPLENQPAEDALLDTANQAIMQMIDRETQEYQQIIDPLSQALQAVQFAQQVEQSEHPMDVTPPQGTVNVDPSQAPGGAQNPMQQQARRRRQAGPYDEGVDALSRDLGRRLIDEPAGRNFPTSGDVPWPEELRHHLQGDPSRSGYDAGFDASWHPSFSGHEDPWQAAGNAWTNAGGRGAGFDDGWQDSAAEIPHRHNDPQGYQEYRSREAKVRTALRNASRVIAQKYRLSKTGERMLLEAMGRRNYEHVREALSLVPPEVRKPAAIHMGEMFAADNPRFNKNAWMKSVLASNPRDRAGDAWRDGRDRGLAEHGRHDMDDRPGWEKYPNWESEHPQQPYDDPETDRWPFVDKHSSRGRLPFDQARLAGETWAETPTEDVFEFPNAGEVPRVSDNNPFNELPKIKGADPHGKNAARTRQAKDIVKKLQNWMTQQQERGLNYGGDVAAESFLSQHPKAGPRATQIVHQTVGADPHPPAEVAAPKVKVPKAVNPVTKKGKFVNEDGGYHTRDDDDPGHVFTNPRNGEKYMVQHEDGTVFQPGQELEGSRGDSYHLKGISKYPEGPSGGKLHVGDGNGSREFYPSVFGAEIIPYTKDWNPDEGQDPFDPRIIGAGRKQASFFTRKVSGWKWDDHLSGYLSKEARAFTCACGEQIPTPSYRTCKCGKIWNVYAIGDTHHLGSNTAEVFIAREIPVRDNVIMANRKMAKGDCQCWEGYERVPGTKPCAEGSCRKCDSHRKESRKSHRELLAEIDKLADWTKYDDEDPSRQGGPSKPPSTKIPSGDTKWHSRNSDGKYLSPAVFPPKKK